MKIFHAEMAVNSKEHNNEEMKKQNDNNEDMAENNKEHNKEKSQ